MHDSRIETNNHNALGGLLNLPEVVLGFLVLSPGLYILLKTLALTPCS